MIPILDTWSDDNVTLGYGLDNGDILTQGGDYRFKEKQGLRTSKIPLLNQGSVMSDPKVVERLASIDVPVKPSSPSTVDRLGRINVPVKPLLTPAVIGRLGEIDIPMKPDNQQKAELDQAAQDLQEEKELDKQKGSEGYEAKEDGVFSRMKGFGDSLGKALLGENYKKDWEAVKEEANKQGWLGYIPQKGATLLETMARSPYARFVDPTTVLGGQRRMVEDIDKYHDRRDIISLRDDLLKQDLVDRQTVLGQAERYAAMPPEERAIIDQYMKNRGVGGYRGVGAKTPIAAAQMRVAERLSNGEDPDLVYQEEALNSGYTPDELRYGVTSSRGQPTKVKDALERETLDLARGENLPIGEAAKRVAEKNGVPVEMALPKGNYTPEDAVEKSQKAGTVKRVEAFTKEGGALDKISTNGADADIYIPMAQEAHNIVLRHKDAFGGGTLGENLTEALVNFGVSDPEIRQAIPALKMIYGKQMASLIASQNVGSISDSERRLFAEQIVSLGDDARSLLIKLELFTYFEDLARDTRNFMSTIRDQPYAVQIDMLDKHYMDRAQEVKDNIRAIVNGSVLRASEETMRNVR